MDFYPLITELINDHPYKLLTKKMTLHSFFHLPFLLFGSLVTLSSKNLKIPVKRSKLDDLLSITANRFGRRGQVFRLRVQQNVVVCNPLAPDFPKSLGASFTPPLPSPSFTPSYPFLFPATIILIKSLSTFHLVNPHPRHRGHVTMRLSTRR